jgi:hypothetical protein
MMDEGRGKILQLSLCVFQWSTLHCLVQYGMKQRTQYVVIGNKLHLEHESITWFQI